MNHITLLSVCIFPGNCNFVSMLDFGLLPVEYDFAVEFVSMASKQGSYAILAINNFRCCHRSKKSRCIPTVLPYLIFLAGIKLEKLDIMLCL